MSGSISLNPFVNWNNLVEFIRQINLANMPRINGHQVFLQINPNNDIMLFLNLGKDLNATNDDLTSNNPDGTPIDWRNLDHNKLHLTIHQSGMGGIDYSPTHVKFDNYHLFEIMIYYNQANVNFNVYDSSKYIIAEMINNPKKRELYINYTKELCNLAAQIVNAYRACDPMAPPIIPLFIINDAAINDAATGEWKRALDNPCELVKRNQAEAAVAARWNDDMGVDDPVAGGRRILRPEEQARAKLDESMEEGEMGGGSYQNKLQKYQAKLKILL